MIWYMSFTKLYTVSKQLYQIANNLKWRNVYLKKKSAKFQIRVVVVVRTPTPPL